MLTAWNPGLGGPDRPSRARRLAGRGPNGRRRRRRRRGPGVSAGRGAPRGRGSSGRRRRRKGRGRAPRPGAASRGVGVQAGGDGGSGAGAAFTVPAGAPDSREPCPICRVQRGGPGQVRPARLDVGSNDVYRRVAPPQSPAPSAGHPEWPNRALPEERKRHSAPPSPLPGFRLPLFPPSGRFEPLLTAPNTPIRAPRGPIRPRMGAPTSPGRRRGAQGPHPRPHCPCSPRSEGFR